MHLKLTVGVVCAASAGLVAAVQQGGATPPGLDARLAHAVAHARQVAREVELRHRLPDGRRLVVSEVTTMRGVATLEILNPTNGSTTSIPTANGVYIALCGHGARKQCAIADGGARAGDALVARRQALELARRLLVETRLDLVAVGLPQTPTRQLLLLFERDLLDSTETGTDAGTIDRLSRGRLYAQAGLIAFSATKDSLALLKLPSRR